MVEDAPIGLCQGDLGDPGVPCQGYGVVLGADLVDLLDGPADEGGIGWRRGVAGGDVGREESGAGTRGEDGQSGGEESHDGGSSGSV